MNPEIDWMVQRTRALEDALKMCMAELEALHRDAQPECVDAGPDTCPAWAAIHAARAALGEQR